MSTRKTILGIRLAVVVFLAFLIGYSRKLDVFASSFEEPYGELKITGNYEDDDYFNFTYNGSIYVEVEGEKLEYIKFCAPETGLYGFGMMDFNQNYPQHIFSYKYDPEQDGYIQIDSSYWGGLDNFQLEKDETIYFCIYSQHDTSETFVVKKYDPSSSECLDVDELNVKFYDYYGTPQAPSDLVKFENKNVTYEMSYAKFVPQERDDPEPVYEYIDGFPKEPGKYNIKISGTNPYYGTTTRTIEIFDEKDISKMKFSHKDIRYGVLHVGIIQPEDIFSIGSFYNNENVTYNMKYKSADAVDDAYTEGIPQEVGDYIIKVLGTGDFSGELTFELSVSSKRSIYNEFDNYTPKKQFGEIEIRLYYQYFETRYFLVKDRDFVILGYTPEDDMNNLTEGMPVELGKYYIKVKGIGDYTGIRYIPVELIEDKLEEYSLNDTEWCDEPMGNNAQLEQYPKYLKYGTDFLCDRYCVLTETAKEGEESTWTESEWVEGAPTAVGRYRVHLYRVGNKSDECTKDFNINEPLGSIDISEIESYEKILESKKTVNIPEEKYIYFKIVPSKTGKYNIYLSDFVIDDEYAGSIHAYLFNSVGYRLAYGEESDEKYIDNETIIEKKLEKNKEYYLRIYSSDYNNKATINIIGDGFTYKYYDGTDDHDDVTPTPAASTPAPAATPTPVPDQQTVAQATPTPESNTKEDTVHELKEGTVKVLEDSKGGSEGKVSYTKAPNKKSVTVPAKVKIKGKTFKVVKLDANAFKGSKSTSVTLGENIEMIDKNALKGSKVQKITIKTKLLTKKSVKNTLKGTKVKTIRVKVGKKKENKKYVKKYKKIFTKKIVGKKVTVN